jgi:16S rRNA (guanine527-N7)-methyltransferase
MLTHHLLDSLAVVPHLLRLVGNRPVQVLDVGSGGGLPGIVLAIARPQTRFTLIDAAQKKCAFLTQARVDLRLGNVEVMHGRVEAVQPATYDLAICRALATLAQFVSWTRQVLRPGGVWLAMKGQKPSDEIADLPPDIAAAVTPLAVPGLAEERHLIEMRLRK